MYDDICPNCGAPGLNLEELAEEYEELLDELNELADQKHDDLEKAIEEAK